MKEKMKQRNGMKEEERKLWKKNLIPETDLLGFI